MAEAWRVSSDDMAHVYWKYRQSVEGGIVWPRAEISHGPPENSLRRASVNPLSFLLLLYPSYPGPWILTIPFDSYFKNLQLQFFQPLKSVAEL